MSIEYKPEQMDVLKSQGKNIIVSASAGSGKTTIMIQKIVNLIALHKNNVKEVLVLTYTKASAEEMKQKLISALYDKAKQDDKLLSQVDDVSIADISTIHSFFQKMIKKYFMTLNINPSFSLIDDTLLKKIKEDAMICALEKYAHLKPVEYKNIVEIYGKSRNEKVIKNLVEKLYVFTKALDNPNAWLEKNALKLYDKNLEQNISLKILNQYLCENINYIIKKINFLQKKCDNLNIFQYVKYCNQILENLCQVKIENNIIENCKTLENFPALRLLKNDDYFDTYLEILNCKNMLKYFIDKVKKWNITNQQDVIKSICEVKESVKVLIELTKIFNEEFERIKFEKNVLDYDDLEKFMLKLLTDEKIKDEIKNSYLEIFVDEYQDANRVQEKILSQIAKPSNRFMVGDVKQSIYGFRQAEPQIFLEKQGEYLASDLSEAMSLNCNFRSNKKILDFVNIIFNTVMTSATAKVDYKNTSQLKAEANYLESDDKIPTVNINIIKKIEKEKNEETTEIYKVKEHLNIEKNYSDAELEGVVVVNKIKNLLGKKIYIPSEKKFREIEFSDITILLRSRGTYLGEFCSTLTKFGIPFFANTNIPLCDDSNVKLLVNILNLCVNSCDDLSLASVMHSVFGGFSYNDMAKIRLNYSSKAFYYECVNEYKKDDEILQKIIALKQFIADFSFDVAYLGLNKTFEKFIQKYQFDSFILNQENGINKYENIKKFVGDFLTNTFDNDIVGFLKFLEQNKDTIPAPSIASGYNCVNITTIHSSKGLEYPIVILADAGKSLIKEPFDAEIKLNQELGIGLKFYEKDIRQKFTSAPYEAITIQNKRNEFAEKLRLLYVALTRAKNHLIIVGTSNSDFKKIDTDFDTMTQKSYLDLIVNSLSDGDIESINNNKEIQNEKYTVNIIEGDFEPNFLENEKFIGGRSSPEIIKTLNDYYNYKYPYKTDVAEKNSVSGIMREEDNYSSQTYAPKNFLLGEHLEDKLSDVGVLYHKVLEEIDFNQINSVNDVSIFLKKKCYSDVIELNSEYIYNSIKLIKKFNLNNYIKEQKFVMKIAHNQIISGGISDKILIQGIIDLIIFGEKNILIDYKYTQNTNENSIINKYKLQLKLYKEATESATNKGIDEVYLLLINQNKLIKIDI